MKTAFNSILRSSGYGSIWISYPMLLIVMVAEATALNLTAGNAIGFTLTAAAQWALMLGAACIFRSICMTMCGGRLRSAFWLTVVFCLLPSTLYWVTEPTWDMARITAAVALLWVLVKIAGARSATFTYLTTAAAAAICAWVLLPPSAEWKYRLASDMGVIRTEHTDNRALRAEISRIYGEADILVDNGRDLYLYTREIPDPALVTEADTEAAADSALAGRGSLIARHIVRRMQWVVRGEPMMYVPAAGWTESIAMLFYPTIGLYVLALAAIGIWLATKRRRDTQYRIACVCCIMSNILSWAVLLWCTCDWPRYLTPCVPATLLLIYYIIRRWHVAPRRLL